MNPTILPPAMSKSYVFTQPLRIMWLKIKFKHVWIQSFSSPRLVILSRLKGLVFTHNLRKDNRMYTFPKGISTL